MSKASMQLTDRWALGFAQKVRGAFGFLTNAGFAEVEVSCTLVRFRKGNVEIDIYHGRHSFEIGCGVSFSGAKYAISEIIRTVSPEAASGHRNFVGTTPEGIAVGLEALATLVQHYGLAALCGERRLVSALEKQRKQWAEGYALEVLADQLRPEAEEAFRRADYVKAAEYYGRIRERLSPAEFKKLLFAQKRSSSD